VLVRRTVKTSSGQSLTAACFVGTAYGHFFHASCKILRQWA